MSRNILILSASVGAGHLRAAQAVELALRQLAPDAGVENYDVLDFTNAAFRRFYGRAYLDLVNRAPHVLGYFYDRLDRPPSPRRKSDRLRMLVEKLNLGKFLRRLREGRWDLIVNTHFLPAEMIALLRRRGEFATPHLTVTTDFETHRLWVNQPCEHYFTATEEGARNLHHWGVPESDTTVTGIPVDPAFSQPKDRQACTTRLGLAGDRPIVLQLAGGFGVGPVERILQGLLAIDQPLEIVVVAGRNEALKEQLQRIESPARHRLHVLGFTTQMDELLAAADVVLSKPGGLTTSETLARGTVMAIVNPIPGQESRNSDFLLENGAAVKINNLSTMTYKLGKLLADPARLTTLKENARRLGRPRAAFDVARAALEWP
ncbi:MAG: glycosyltransferase [Pirellulales bacterium]|nr:glycosyltransferase [Pirellulales bacterium]